jgi:hypothetical protein
MHSPEGNNPARAWAALPNLPNPDYQDGAGPDSAQNRPADAKIPALSGTGRCPAA